VRRRHAQPPRPRGDRPVRVRHHPGAAAADPDPAPRRHPAARNQSGAGQLPGSCLMTDTPGAILEELMKLAGEQPAQQRATFTGADPILPTPFRIGDLGAAVIAASAVQAARLLEQRAGLVQTVHVDVDAAAVALRASRYLTAVPRYPRRAAARSVSTRPPTAGS